MYNFPANARVTKRVPAAPQVLRLSSPTEGLKARVVSLLRASERYTKTDMVYVTTSGFWLILGQSVSAVATLGLAIAFANLLDQELYGNYKYALAVASVMGTLTLTGFTSAVMRSKLLQKAL